MLETIHASPDTNSVLDGYRLIRRIGAGGFGVVWLCQNETTAEFRALKWIDHSFPGHLEQELKSLKLWMQGLRQIHCANLVPIEHVRLSDEGLLYVMPLADGMSDTTPAADESWVPFTLDRMIRQRRQSASWFTSSEIISIMAPLLKAAECLSSAALVHRDIKPENVIFIRGVPCLSDCGLATRDAEVVSHRGTPLYVAPSWYVESGGNHDMWACACLLYTLLTGNVPDKMGKAAFLWPPQGESLMSVSERKEWLRLHQLTFRATADHSKDRFSGFGMFLAAIDSRCVPPTAAAKKPRRAWVAFGGTLACLLLAVIVCRSGSAWYRPSHVPLDHSVPASPEEGAIHQTSRIDDMPQFVLLSVLRGKEASLSSPEYWFFHIDDPSAAFSREIFRIPAKGHVKRRLHHK